MKQEIDISRLTVPERLALVEQLWDSILPSEMPPLTDVQKQELDQRWAAFEAGEMGGSGWAEVKQSLRDQ